MDSAFVFGEGGGDFFTCDEVGEVFDFVEGGDGVVVGKGDEVHA